MDRFWQDFRYGTRLLFKNPGLTAVAVISLALGIGANTTIFALVNALFLRPLPVSDPERLVAVYTSDFSGPPHGGSSYPDYLDFKNRTDVFSGLLASASQPLSLGYGEETGRVFGEIVTGNYFEVLGVKALSGRTFLSEEDQAPGTHPVAVVSHGLWRRRFGAEPGLIGQAVLLNGHPFTVIGIAPENFSGTQPLFSVDLWVPMMMQKQLAQGRDRLNERNSRWLFIMGRLKPEATLHHAQAAFDVLADQLKQEYGRAWIDVKGEGRRITAVSERENRVPPRIRGGLAGFLGLLMGVVGLVLLIACANVANLLLSRAVDRRKEIAIRLSLGAGRGRVVCQLLTESALLSIIGGAVSLLIGLWVSQMIVAFKPPIPFPVSVHADVDLRVLAFTMALSLITAVLFGLAPALQASKADLVPSLKDDPGAYGSGYRRSRLKHAFVVAQVTLALLLLIGSGLFLRSLMNASAIDPGFDPNNVLLMSFDLQLSGYPEVRGKEFYQQVLDRVQGLPGVVSAGLASSTPLSLFGSRRGTIVEGYTRKPGEDMEFHYSIVSPDYLQILRIPLALGRTFTPRDREGAPGVVIVNETFARRFWPDQIPIGKRIGVAGPQGPRLEVVGVTKDGKYNTLGEPPTPFFYVSSLQHYQSGMTLFVKTAGDPQSIVGAVRSEIRNLDRNLPVTDVKTLVDHLGIALFPARAAATALGAFGILALTLASVGIYGVLSHAVSQRTRELGIRRALGAQDSDVFKLVVGQAMMMVLIGMGLGILAALAVTRFLSTLLYGISATDPLTFAGISLLLALVALAASFIPARRATGVDPATALRYE